tara:strand:- start:366 stop:548 length:183 start_codon:yes stop_codon:yes gene_type:complete
MTKVTQRNGEDRKEYLVRVAIEMLMLNGYTMENIIFDDAECDALCLAGDLTIEFDLDLTI